MHTQKAFPAGRLYFKKCIHLPAYFFGGFMYTHAYALFLLSQFCRHSSAAGIPTKIPLSRLHRLQPYIFLHLFFFINSNDRQRKKNRAKEKAISIHFNFIRIKSKEATAEQKKQKKYKNKRICRNKKNVFVNRGFPRTSIKNKRKIKKSKG